MATGTLEHNLIIPTELIDQQPIRLDVTFPAAAPVPSQVVIPQTLGQLATPDHRVHDIPELGHILSSPSHAANVPFELAGKERATHQIPSSSNISSADEYD